MIVADLPTHACTVSSIRLTDLVRSVLHAARAGLVLDIRGLRPVHRTLHHDTITAVPSGLR